MSAITAPADLQPYIAPRAVAAVGSRAASSKWSITTLQLQHTSQPGPFAQSLITTTADTSLQVCNQDAQPKFRQSTHATTPCCPCTQQAHLPEPASTQQQLSLPGLEPPQVHVSRASHRRSDLNGMCGTSRQLARVCCSALVEHMPGRGVTNPILICLHPGRKPGPADVHTCTWLAGQTHRPEQHTTALTRHPTPPAVSLASHLTTCHRARPPTASAAAAHTK